MSTKTALPYTQIFLTMVGPLDPAIGWDAEHLGHEDPVLARAVDQADQVAAVAGNSSR
ncbi:MAG: hypothetical protein ACI91O_001450 [Candidatus Poriferisodalaceae bacterium]|jgi:hypothetical protein